MWKGERAIPVSRLPEVAVTNWSLVMPIFFLGTGGALAVMKRARLEPLAGVGALCPFSFPSSERA